MIKGFAKASASSVVYLAVALVMYSAMKNTRPSSIDHANAVTGVVENVVPIIYLAQWFQMHSKKYIMGK